MQPASLHRWLALLAASAALLASGCSADQYRRDADLEVDRVIRDKELQLFKKESGFTIEAAHDVLRTELLKELESLRAARQSELVEQVVPHAGEAKIGPTRQVGPTSELARESAAKVQQQLETRLADVERRHAGELKSFEVTAPPLLARRVLTLKDALEIASDNSRDYQSQKERVYVVALDLTLQRYLFEARFGVTSTYDWSATPGTPERTREGDLTTKFSLTKKLATGGLLVFSFTNNLLRRFTGVDFTNGRSSTTSSLLDLTFTQPLLQGAGRVAEEPLIQAERDAFYELRAFERFRQTFAVTVARDYYTLLQELDQIANARRSYLQFIDAREQSEALAAAGRRSQIQLDQATQSELTARNSWVVAQRSYQDALDRFKISLGLPIEADLALDPIELEHLRTPELSAVNVGEERAIAIALTERLDHLNELDRLDDQDRQVGVAADSLRAALDLTAGIAMPTERDRVFDVSTHAATWHVGATLDLPVDKLAQRNTYRAALIRRDAQSRAVALSGDSVKEDVRDALRHLAQLRETWRIAVMSVEVSERRVQSTALTLRMGRIQIRDALDATDALNRAKNQLTSSLVDYKIAEFELARDMGLLHLGPEGIELVNPSDATKG